MKAACTFEQFWGAHPMCLVEIWVKVSDFLSSKAAYIPKLLMTFSKSIGSHDCDMIQFISAQLCWWNERTTTLYCLNS